MKKVIKTIATFALVLTGFFAVSETTTTTASAATSDDFSNIYQVAKAHMGARYVYGATGPTAFDCSGFTGYVYKKGDLVFFGGSKYSISHVGLYVGNGKMIDAQNRGVVREAVHAPWWHAVGYARVSTSSSATTDAN